MNAFQLLKNGTSFKKDKIGPVAKFFVRKFNFRDDIYRILNISKLKKKRRQLKQQKREKEIRTI